MYVSFDLGSMKNLSTRVTELDKTQHKISGICRRFMSCINIYGFGGNFVYHSSNMLFEFCVFKDKSQVLCIREQVSYHPTISHIPISLIKLGPYDECSQVIGILARNKEYANFIK